MSSHKVIQSYLILAAAIIVLGILVANQQWWPALWLTILLLLYGQFERLNKLEVSAGKLSASLGDVLGTERAKALEKDVIDIIGEYERKTGRVVPPKTRETVADTVEEGLVSRLDELEQRLNRKFGSAAEAQELGVKQAKEAIVQVLSDADGTKREVSIAEINRSVKANFCKVWPFC